MKFENREPCSNLKGWHNEKSKKEWSMKEEESQEACGLLETKQRKCLKKEGSDQLC